MDLLAGVAAGHRRVRYSHWANVNWITVAALTLLAVDGVFWLTAIRAGFTLPAQGLDLMTYRTAAQTFLAGGPWYPASQLSGPFALWGSGQPILYPPNAIPLFAACTVLPGFLWWAIPAGLIGWSLRDARWPRLLLIAGLLAWPQTVSLIWAGNPVMWMAAFLAVGLSPLVLLKPTLFVFALPGIRSRRWWIGLAVLVVLSLPFLGLWGDYLRVIENARDDQTIWYVAGNVPLMLVGYLGSGRPRRIVNG